MSRKPATYASLYNPSLDEARVPGSFFGRPWGKSAPAPQSFHRINSQVAYLGNVHNAYAKDVVRRAAAHLKPQQRRAASLQRQPSAKQQQQPRRRMRLDPMTGNWVYA